MHYGQFCIVLFADCPASALHPGSAGGAGGGCLQHEQTNGPGLWCPEWHLGSRRERDDGRRPIRRLGLATAQQHREAEDPHCSCLFFGACSAALGAAAGLGVSSSLRGALRLYDDIGGEVHPGIWANDGPHRDGRPRIEKLVPAELDCGVVVEVLNPQVTRGGERERVGAVQGPGGAARHG